MRIPVERRFEGLKLQDASIVHVGMELAQDRAFSVMLTQRDFAKNLRPIPTFPKLWDARQKLLSPEDVHLRQRKLGEWCWLGTVSRPDICARSARIAPRTNSLQGGDVYRINAPMETAKTWNMRPPRYGGRPATTLKGRSCASEKNT